MWGFFGVFFLTILSGADFQVIFKFADVIIWKITLMSSDTRALSPAMWGDISGEGTSNEGVRVDFPGLGSRPSLSSSCVTVLGFSLEKLAVIMVAVLPGQPQRQRPRKDGKTRFKGRMKSRASGPFIISPPFFQLLLLQ